MLTADAGRYEVLNMRIAHLIFLLLISANSFAANNYRAPPSMKAGTYPDYIDTSHYEVAGVSIGYSKFPEIIAVFGEAAESNEGDHIEKKICYRNKSQVIEFYISSVGFGYNVYNKNLQLKNCGTTSKYFGSKFGLELGLSETIVKNMLGEHSEIRGDELWYIYWVQEEPSKEAQDKLRDAFGLSQDAEIWLDIYSSVSVEFENQILTHFGIHTTETY